MHISLAIGRRSAVLCGVVLLSLALAPDGRGRAQAADPTAVRPSRAAPEAFVRISERIKPAVVNISAVYEDAGNPYDIGSPFEQFFEDFFSENEKTPAGKPPRKKDIPPHRYEGTGSGVIVDPEGYILTNEHVVRDARDITVTLSNEKKFDATVVGRDSRLDLAVIKISAGHNVPYARLGDSDRIKVGDWALAIGSPFGLESSVTTGIVSALRQSLPIEGHDYRDLIQTDAAINRGNSGGPLCNIYGEVVGINTAIYAPTGVFSGVGFAVPINSARKLLDEFVGRGKVVRGWLGIEIRALSASLARRLRLGRDGGVLVSGVVRNSPASRAGLKKGDVILRFEGNPVADVRGLQAMVAGTEPLTRVTLTVVRDGREQQVEVMSGELPDAAHASADLKAAVAQESGSEGNVATVSWQGMRLATFTTILARRYTLAAGEKGCVILQVLQGSPADDMGLQSGDLIYSVNRVPTPTVREFQEAVKNVKLSRGIVLDINRQGKPLYLSYQGKE